MTNFGHSDYTTHLFDESDRAKRIAGQVVENSGTYLDGFSDFIKQRFIERSGIVKNLTYAKVENIKQTLQSAVFEGFRLYTCVANLNNRSILRRPNQSMVQFYNAVIDDEQNRQRLLGRYDVMPVIDRYEEVIFSSFMNEHPEFEDYPYKEVSLLRLTIFLAVQSSYLLCLASCE